MPWPRPPNPMGLNSLRLTACKRLAVAWGLRRRGSRPELQKAYRAHHSRWSQGDQHGADSPRAGHTSATTLSTPTTQRLFIEFFYGHQDCHEQGRQRGKSSGSAVHGTSERLIPAAAASGHVMPILDPPSAMLEGLGTYSHQTVAFNSAKRKCKPCVSDPRSIWEEAPFTMV